MKDFLIKYSPFFVQNILISFYNTFLYKRRHAGKYKDFFHYYSELDNGDLEETKAKQNRKLEDFLDYACTYSSWYKSYKGLRLKEFPILEKEDIIKNLNTISTIPEYKGIKSLTGGTTGASLKVIYTYEDMQERFAILDSFRSKYGYRLGKRTAWFSGKNLINKHDILRERYYKDDLINHIRFFSTFHINEKNFYSYWKSLDEFSPMFIVGFPSSLYDLCLLAKNYSLILKNKVKFFFPTAETVLPEHRSVINDVLGCELVDQYASSEGAPFILQCKAGNLHIHPLTGIFEVLDENGNESYQGELVVTSFTTHGTPLIRYRVGDRITLYADQRACDCGSCYPLVKSIDGRSTDYVYSPEMGKVNLGNISNSTKDVNGILKFQVIQNDFNNVLLKIKKTDLFSNKDRDKFILNLRKRIGDKMGIKIEFVEDILKEKSGKYRIVINNMNIKNNEKRKI